MGISRSEMVSTGQRRIAELAKQAPQMSFTSLNRYLTSDWLREAYRLTRKDGAAGIDGQTSTEYESELEKNLQQLADRAHAGTYFAPPVKRAFIPKGPGCCVSRPVAQKAGVGFVLAGTERLSVHFYRLHHRR